MTDLIKDDTHDDYVPRERKRRPKKMLPKRLLRLLVFLALIIVLVVVIVLVARSAANSGRVADYQRYIAQIGEMLEQSDAMGKELVAKLTNPGDTTRKDIQSRLDQYIANSARLELEAVEMDAPKEMVRQNIHQFFVLTMTFRHKGLASLKPSLMTALEVQDVEVSSEQICRSIRYLTTSDFLYAEVFAPRAADMLQTLNITGVNVPPTRFVDDCDLASKSRVQEVLAVLKSTENLQAVHGVALAKVVVLPEDKEVKGGATFNLVANDDLTFQISVENQGNMAEKDVPVLVTLLSPDESEPQRGQATIPELKPNEELAVMVTGLKPTAYGEIGLLRVEVGPVKGEKYKDNNWIEANVIFTL
jgi:uncharacterized cupredoxin-like copper-binding protein